MKIYLLRWEKQIILTVSWFYKLQISDKDTGTSICIFVPGPENFGRGLPVHSLPASSHFCRAPATYAGHFTLSFSKNIWLLLILMNPFNNLSHLLTSSYTAHNLRCRLRRKGMVA